MRGFWTAMFFAAGFAAFGAQAGAEDLRLPVSLTSFGAAQAISSYQMSAAAVALGPAQSFSVNAFAGSPLVLPVAYGSAALAPSFAASSALNINLALDAGYNLDLTQRFDNYTALQSPLIDSANFIGLANGGNYSGITYVPLPSLRLRAGVQSRNDRLDSFTFDPTLGASGMPASFDSGGTRSLLAGTSWEFAGWGGLNVSGIVSQKRSDGFAAAAGSVSTAALNVSAHVNFGGGWVTSAAFSKGLSQLDQKSDTPTSIDSNAYSIAIAKHGLFGSDAVGFSFSRPMPNLLDNGFEMVSASGDLPPSFAVNSRLPGSTSETDLQLGYVTSFLNGALDLQANAAYQMNYQGQTGATSLAVLSRAKIKF